MNIKVANAELHTTSGVVTVEGSSQEDVTSPAAKNLAIEEASKKLRRPGISSNPAPYAVDANGESSENLALGRMPAHAWRCDYSIADMP